MSIKNIQDDFIEGIFGGDKEPAASHVIGDKKLTAKERFGIYRGSVHGILSQTLELTYPVCKSLVGDKFFDNMISIFIDKHPPNTSFFAEYGNKFPEFLSTFEHVKDIPYIVDVANLEWARHKIWHKKDKQATDFSKLSEITEEQQVTFTLSETVHLLQSKYRIDDIWFAHQDDSELKFDEINLNEAVKLIIWKEEGIIKISLMNQSADDSMFWGFLDSISKGSTLEELAEQFGGNLPQLLNQGIQSSWVQSFTINN